MSILPTHLAVKFEGSLQRCLALWEEDQSSKVKVTAKTHPWSNVKDGGERIRTAELELVKKITRKRG